jgi:hypothetical protein
MSNLRSRIRSVAALGTATIVLVAGARAYGQACCAGTGVVTPGRLALHEAALVGTQVKVGSVLGSFDPTGSYVASPRGAQELDFEQDAFGALRAFERAQVAVLVPFVQTWRSNQGQSELGGGVGDINLSIRYDFTLAGASLLIPGIAVLAGVTFPTGKPPDAPDIGAQSTGSTGVGAYQFNLGVAVEHVFGPWLANATGVVAQRTARTATSGGSTVHERLGLQWTLLAALAYTFPEDVAIALSVSYLVEGNNIVEGTDREGTARRLGTVTLSGTLPLGDTWRLQGALFDNPPISQLGLNSPADAGLSLALVRSWM